MARCECTTDDYHDHHHYQHLPELHNDYCLADHLVSECIA